MFESKMGLVALIFAMTGQGECERHQCAESHSPCPKSFDGPSKSIRLAFLPVFWYITGLSKDFQAQKLK